MAQSIKKALSAYGLDQKEAQLYELLLRRVEATVFSLAQDAGIPRTTVYATLESLKRKGLATSFKKNNVLYYTPESPRRLLSLLKQKERFLSEALPQMEGLVEKSRLKPIVRVYAGREGIKQVLDDILETIETQKLPRLAAVSHPEVLAYLPRFFPNWIEQLVKSGVQRRLLLPEAARKVPAYYSDKRNRETRFLPNEYPFQASFDIYGNKIALFSIKGSEAFAMIIESANIAHMYQALFDFIWTQIPEERK